MRFLIIAFITSVASTSIASVQGFNGMIAEVSKQESLLHKKLLRSLQNTRTAIAYNERLEHIKNSRLHHDGDFRVVLVKAAKP